MSASLPWRTVALKAMERIEELRSQLERAPDIETVRKLQGGIAELRRVIELPTLLSDDESRRIQD